MNNLIQIFSNRCWLDGKLQPATISVENGIISGISTGKLTGATDMGNLVLMPGVIDAHVHVNEPGRTDWEGFDTATLSAAAGGITTIIDMPLNASPVTTNLKAFKEKLAASENKMHVNAGFYGGLVPGNTNELEAMIQAGVLGIKCFLVHSGIDEFPNVGEKEIDEAMKVMAPYHVPLLAHCEIYEQEVNNAFSENVTSYKHYLESRPKQWEDDAVDLVAGLCEKNNCPTHVVHVSSAGALKRIAKAKSDGLPLTAETCAHYIFFNAEDIPDADCLYKCAPPIREKENNDQLKTALKNGVLDFLASDHSPAPPEIKELESGNLKKAWGGIAGLQFLLPASWTALKDSMSLENFIPLLTEKPAAFLNVAGKKGYIKVGYDADLVIWDPENAEIADVKDILFRHKISPYIGKKLFGTVIQTVVNGVTVYQDKKIKHKNSGKWLLRK